MNSRLIRKACILALTLGAACAATPANAVDLRSWDQKFNSAANRFVVLTAFDDEAVLDKETQLVWQRTPYSSLSAVWPAAHHICDRAAIGGRFGWRLPSIHELVSLLESRNGVYKLQDGHPFLDVSASMYWSSTPYPTSINIAEVLGFGASQPVGLQGSGSSTPRIWCVRGPA
jgi:hypothetical protein